MTAALSEKQNIVIHDKVLSVAADLKNNGGYNFFEVFVKSYLGIWYSFLKKGVLSGSLYEREKYLLFRYLLLGYIDKLLIKKDIGRFKIEKAWYFLLKTYGLYPYFYGGIIYLYAKNFKNRILK